MITVTLTWPEVHHAAFAGIMRHISALQRGRIADAGFQGRAWEAHVRGCLGEYAAAKAFNLPWFPEFDTVTASDVCGLEIRTRAEHWHDLSINDNAKDQSAYVLVTGEAPTFVLRGWLWGHEARQQKWRKRPDGKIWAFYVPQADLHPLETLPRPRLVLPIDRNAAARRRPWFTRPV